MVGVAGCADAQRGDLRKPPAVAAHRTKALSFFGNAGLPRGTRHQPVTLVELGGGLIAAIIAVRQSARTVAEEDVIRAAALIEVDGVRPGICQRTLPTPREPLTELHDQSVVVAVAAGLHAVHAPPRRVHAVDQAVAGSDVLAHRLALRVVDLVSHGRPRTPDVEVAHRGQVDGAAPHPRDAEVEARGDCVFDRQIRLVSVRVPVVPGGNRQIDGGSGRRGRRLRSVREEHWEIPGRPAGSERKRFSNWTDCWSMPFSWKNVVIRPVW